jgi:hypothetical protein
VLSSRRVESVEDDLRGGDVTSGHSGQLDGRDILGSGIASTRSTGLNARRIPSAVMTSKDGPFVSPGCAMQFEAAV